MEISKNYEGVNLLNLMAKEFIEERLGFHATDKEIQLFANHICQFQSEIAQDVDLA